MIRYEFKKVLGRTSGKIALLVLAGLVAISCWLAVSRVEWVNAQGVTEYGPAAAAKLRAAQNEWRGTLDTEKLASAIAEFQRINATPEAQSDDVVQRNIVYSREQGLEDIRNLLAHAFADGFRSYNYYTADHLTPDQAPQFYDNRVRLLKEWLYDENDVANDLYSPEEKAWIIAQYEALETPFEYEYCLGWQKLCDTSETVISFTAIILGYLMAVLFAGEFRWRTEAVFFASALGRTRANAAKIKAGIALTTLLYWLAIGLYTAFVLLYTGADGANCPVQLGAWKSPYNLTFLQAYALGVLGGYLGCLFIALFTMWVAARTRLTVFATTAPFLLIILPQFAGDLPFKGAAKALALFPDRLLKLTLAMNYFDLFSVFGRVVGALPVVIGLYALLTLLLLPIVYLQYRRAQIL